MTDLGDAVQALYREGTRPLDIAHRLNIAQSTVHYHVRKLTEAGETDPAAQRGRGRRPSSGIRTRELVAALLAKGLSRVEIAQRLGLAKSTVTYHALRLGEDIDGRFGKRFDWSLVQTYYDEGHSVRDCARTFGFSTWSWHEAVKRGAITPRPAFRPLHEVFAANTRRSRGHLKIRLLQAGLKDGRCERCGLSEWLGAPLAIALHHVNGDRHDNRIENLELLCPNCHSQTDTFAGRNGRRTEDAAA
jgi:DNA-binding CsgD family transcriptional regulator